jgi:hypothetical protein
VNNADIRVHIEGRQKFDMTHLYYVGSSGGHSLHRSVSKRFNVRPGSFVIIPNTQNCDINGEHLLRVFTEKQANQTTVCTWIRMILFCFQLTAIIFPFQRIDS